MMRRFFAIVCSLFIAVCTHAQVMVEVRAGSFTMGNTSYARENPIRTVSIGRFYLSKHDITNAQFADFLNAYGSDTVLEGAFSGKPLFVEDSWGVLRKDAGWQAAVGYENFPMVKVTWFGAQTFCQAAGGRLPTEAEWEYAAKGGPSQQTYTFSGSSTATAVAWFADNSGHLNAAVGLKTANNLGLFDMSGNVYQWCSDWFGRYGDFGVAGESNPTGPSSGVSKVIRGGYRSLGSGDLHLSNRESLSPSESLNFVGFRLAMDQLPTDLQQVKNETTYYPNPADEGIHLTQVETITRLEVLDFLGRTLYGTVHPAPFVQTQDLPEGTYILRLTTSDGTKTSKLTIHHP